MIHNTSLEQRIHVRKERHHNHPSVRTILRVAETERVRRQWHAREVVMAICIWLAVLGAAVFYQSRQPAPAAQPAAAPVDQAFSEESLAKKLQQDDGSFYNKLKGRD